MTKTQTCSFREYWRTILHSDRRHCCQPHTHQCPVHMSVLQTRRHTDRCSRRLTVTNIRHCFDTVLTRTHPAPGTNHLQNQPTNSPFTSHHNRKISLSVFFLKIQVCVQLGCIRWQRGTARIRPPRCCAPCSNRSISPAGRPRASLLLPWPTLVQTDGRTDGHMTDA